MWEEINLPKQLWPYVHPFLSNLRPCLVGRKPLTRHHHGPCRRLSEGEEAQAEKRAGDQEQEPPLVEALVFVLPYNFRRTEPEKVGLADRVPCSGPVMPSEEVRPES